MKVDMLKPFLLPLLLLATVLPPPAAAQAQHAGHAAPAPAPAAAPCTAPLSLSCAKTATPTFAADGGLYVAWAQDGHVWVARSDDLGRTFSTPGKVNPERQPIDENGENRPKLAVDGATVFVTYTVKAGRPYSGDVLYSRSTDGGASFAAPRSLSDEAKLSSMRFDVLGLGSSGRLYAAWIDKRRTFAAEADGGKYVGAALAVAWSDDGGATFSANRIVQDHTCECCRLGLAFDSRGLPVIVWRNVFGANVRDHALLAFADKDTPGAVQRISDDDWAIDACPHHGPALALGPADARHVAWFTQGKKRQGLFYARAEASRAFSAPMAFGNAKQAPSHPALQALGQRVVLAWKEFTGIMGVVQAMISEDGGATWSAPHTVAQSAGASDQPLLVRRGDAVYLSWLTAKDGYRLLPVGGAR